MSGTPPLSAKKLASSNLIASHYRENGQNLTITQAAETLCGWLESAAYDEADPADLFGPIAGYLVSEAAAGLEYAEGFAVYRDVPAPAPLIDTLVNGPRTLIALAFAQGVADMADRDHAASGPGQEQARFISQTVQQMANAADAISWYGDHRHHMHVRQMQPTESLTDQTSNEACDMFGAIATFAHIQGTRFKLLQSNEPLEPAYPARSSKHPSP